MLYTSSCRERWIYKVSIWLLPYTGGPFGGLCQRTWDQRLMWWMCGLEGKIARAADINPAERIHTYTSTLT